MLRSLTVVAAVTCGQAWVNNDDESGLLQVTEIDSNGNLMEAKTEIDINGELVDTVVSSLKNRAHKKPPASLLMRKADAKIAKAFREYRQDPNLIAQAVQTGIQAILDARMQFQNGNTAEGIVTLGEGLLNAIDGPLQAAQQGEEPMFAEGSEAYNEFVANWRGFFAQGPEHIQSIMDLFTAYQEEGEVSSLVEGISEILTLLETHLLSQLPARETLQEIMRYMNAIEAVLDSVGDTIQAFENGEPEGAIGPLYQGIRTGLSNILPEDLQNDDTYQLVVGSLDGVMGNLSSTIAMYKRELVEANTCWRANQMANSRTRELPSRCPVAGYYHVAGSNFCMRTPSLVQEEEAEGAMSGKGDGATSGKGVPDDGTLAMCNTETEFTEMHGRYCYAPCPSNKVPLQGGGCRTRCGHEFAAESRALCGRSQGAINQAIHRMATETLGSLINIGAQIATMAQAEEVNATAISNTLTALSRIGLPFAKPDCDDARVGAATR